MQTWNNILNYIKLNLGANLNFLEMSDDEIIQAIKEHTLPFFSQYSPNKKYCFVTTDNIIIGKPGENQFMFKIPVTDYIIDVDDVYPSTSDSIALFDETNMVINDPNAAIDTVILNQYADMSKYLSIRNTWEFIQPNIISMDASLTAAIIVYNTVHDDVSTIRPDFYNIIFKKLCLGNVQKWVAMLRSKYNLTTPFGEIKVNWEKIEADSQQNIQEAMQLLDLTPLDKFVEIS